MDGIDLRELELVEETHSSDLKSNKNDSTTEATHESTLINKVTELNFKRVEELCEACIESKHMRIVKSKKMTITTKKLQEVHANL